MFWWLCYYVTAQPGLFFRWYKTQKGAKELGYAVPQSSLFLKLKPSQLLDLFWTKLSEFERVLISLVSLLRTFTHWSQCFLLCAQTYVNTWSTTWLWMLAPHIHVKEDGTLIPRSEREFFWVESIVQSKGIVPRVTSPISPLHAPLDGLKEITQENSCPQCLFLVGVHSMDDLRDVLSLWCTNSCNSG